MALRVLGCMLVAFTFACGTDYGGNGSYGGTVAAPYESCTLQDGCTNGTACLPTTLPASAGYTGYSCTNGCNADRDCLQDLNNYAAICVNAQCYIRCPNGSQTCPYGTGCVSFADQEGFLVNVCTP